MGVGTGARGRRAWHAGLSWWGGTTDLNSASIGIELDNTGEEAFAEAQIAALLTLLGLQALGYDIANPPAARQAFRRHFAGSDADGELAQGERSLLNCLLRKKASGETGG